MKNTYPIILTPEDTGYTVYIPDFDINTEGDDMTESIEMARDAIGLAGNYLEDEQKPLPLPSVISSVHAGKDEIITLVDVDFDDYRRKNSVRSVKKNCTIPGWLNYEAEKANINFSALLQNAIKKELHIPD